MSDRYQDAIKNTQRFLSQYIWIGVLLTILGVFWYYRTQIGKKVANVDKMETAYDKPKYAPQLSSINASDPKYNDPLLNFRIASSYNSCCAGDFQDSYVTLDPLEEIIFHGARVLDFAVYSIDGKAVVAASPFQNPNIKGTYNSIPIDKVLQRVSQLAFSSAKCANPGDPLFLHFRIKSNRKDVYPPLTSAIKSNFAGKLLDARWSFEGRRSSGQTINLTMQPLKSLMGKVIILAHQENDNYKDENNSFYELVNLGSNSIYFRQLRNHAVQYAPNIDDFKGETAQSLTLTMPDWSEINTNVPIITHQALGCQMVCMNYQNLDKNMKYYLDYFNTGGCAFIKKPANLCMTETAITCPTPPPKEQSFKGKKYNLPMVNFTM